MIVFTFLDSCRFIFKMPISSSYSSANSQQQQLHHVRAMSAHHHHHQQQQQQQQQQHHGNQQLEPISMSVHQQHHRSSVSSRVNSSIATNVAKSLRPKNFGTTMMQLRSKGLESRSFPRDSTAE
ncbi:MAG: hypothetical protein ACK4GU_17070, partial [Alishewanella aestuarii]